MALPFSCPCPLCQRGEDHPDRDYHAQLRSVVGLLNERQRRWVAALEAKRLGYGGVRLVAQITGLDEKTIRRGSRELQAGLEMQPTGRVRRPGAGRRPTEKKLRPLSNAY